MEGFFSATEIRSTKFIPPRPQVTFPPAPPEKAKPRPDLSASNQLIVDIECYVNYFLVKFRRVRDGRIVGSFERTERTKLDCNGIKSLIKRYEVVTFNGNAYDILILRYAFTGASNKELKIASDALIKGHLASWRFEKDYDLPELKINHIDISELLPGFVSLKIHGARLHCPTLRDLPYPPNQVLTDDEMDNVDEYCGNDLGLTELVLIDLLPQIQLRREMSEKYGMDLLSKSDAQIAEIVLKSEIEKVIKKELKKPDVVPGKFYYKAPSFIKFSTDKLRRVLDIVTTNPFIVTDSGNTLMPKELSDLQVKIGVSTYKMGIGGLHSSEKTAFHVSDDKYSIHDWDATSFYPYIIMLLGLYPKNVGHVFKEVYPKIVDERVTAKKSGDKVKADALKITINGTFGKTGSPYSVLYEPSMMIQITVTGQLSLLMLIEMLESEGISVVSGNTDGVVMKCPRDKDSTMRAIIRRFERTTGFVMEESKYVGLYSRDVNNYIAIQDDGKVKTKGCFSPASLSKNPENDICSIAMINYLKYGTPFEKTIRGCTDITKFLTVRSVKEGAYKHYDIGEVPHHNSKEELCRLAGFHETYGGYWLMEGSEAMSATTLDLAYKISDGKLRTYKNTVYLGKAIRWYHAKNVRGPIYTKTGNAVPVTDGAKPLMTLDGTFPNDVDYDWYITACERLFR